MVVHVTKAIRHQLRDQRELAACEAGHRVPLREHHAPQRRDVGLEVEDLLGEARIRLGRRSRPRARPAGRSTPRSPDGSGRPSRRRSGAAAPTGPSASTRLFREHTRAHLFDRSRDPGMDGDQKLLADEEIHVLRLEVVLALTEIDAVEDQIQVVTVRFNLGMVDLAERILDREIVEFEDVGQDPRFVRRRIAQIDPDPDAAARPAARPDPPARRIRWSRSGCDRS